MGDMAVKEIRGIFSLAWEAGAMEIGYETFTVELDRLKRNTAQGREFWRAREIQGILGYQRWERFSEVIEKAQMACTKTEVDWKKHFLGTGEMVDIGSGAQRERGDWILSRYACYLIAMNGDSTKPEVSYAQAYFAVQTRRQEVQDQLTATERRLLLRDRVKEANKKLASAAKEAGVRRFPIFQDEGYKGLYGGLGQGDIKRRKGIDEKQALLDCIGRAELAANEFRITQTEQKLVREKTNTEEAAFRAHHAVGAEVRQTIKKIGGTMPEDLSAEEPIKRLAANERKRLRDTRKKMLGKGKA
jgi:DNA-damage-inducible protein D